MDADFLIIGGGIAGVSAAARLSALGSVIVLEAEGALAHSTAEIAVSITGIAGPGGGSDEKPVGLVHFAVTAADGTIIHVEKRFGAAGRDKVRLESVRVALSLLLEVVSR